ncbi:glycosyltransferase family 90 protein [Calocera viscosa TUFC12733]|uniref:Glycosyltransferase family 90 protein n=1 Tax=Calocera viscosa (strain TUFC12733) TaxID=1330018 RepID=A0A167PQ75_CALVF|nr:glycosyltransferase family 90 protein [Calocera viscosa TUFC12733]
MNSAPRRRVIIAAVSLIAVVFIIVHRRRNPDSTWFSLASMSSSSSVDRGISHPIPQLMLDAQTKFRALVARQSQTLDQAVREYKKRYKRSPPKGFDKWWKFCEEHDVKVRDEFDQMMRDLEPFFSLPPEELRRRAEQVALLPSIDLVRIRSGDAKVVNIQNGFDDSEVSARARGFKVMIEPFMKDLPDLDFPINAKAEGRILIPWEHVQYPNMTKQDSSGGVEDMLGGKFIPDWRGDSSVWEAFRRTCPPTSAARRLYSATVAQLESGQIPMNRISAQAEAKGKAPVPSGDFSFQEDTDDHFSFCDHPEIHVQQGHFFSDWRTIPVLYPVFSPAKAPGFSDILIPSHYYYASTKRYTYGWDPVREVIKETDDGEVRWNRKKDLIFWRGATTGGGSSPPGFIAHYQRHRFIRMTSDVTSDNNRTLVVANPPGTNHYVAAQVPIPTLNSFIDAAFTKAVGCSAYPGGGCEAMRREHRFADAVLLNEHWKYKYLMDVDGMGYSARFMGFLASESAVMKTTVYLEYFSEWIQPWLHFIPVSQNYQEIYNVYAYFSGTDSLAEIANATFPVAPTVGRRHDGDTQLRLIAKAGRQWKKTIGRKVDMEAYVYRLCLEYARLWADDRDEASY